MSTEHHLEISIQGGFGVISLDRAASLNALSKTMINGIIAQLDLWQDEPAVQAVLINSKSPKAFCAGGDIRYLYDCYKNGSTGYQDYFAAEYRMLAEIRHFIKPVVVLLDGYVMGGGFGLAQACHIRVSSEKSRFSMPETAIGYFPDVVATYILSRLKEVGVYMALSSEQISSSDALYLGLIDHHVDSTRLAELEASLLAATQVDRASIEQILAGFATPAAQSQIQQQQAMIAQHFAAHTVQEIEQNLAQVTDPAQQAWAEKILNILQQRSWIAKTASLKLLQAAAQLSLEQCMQLERDVQDIWFDQGDIVEGVRALIIDKDKQPKWQTDNPALDRQIDALIAVQHAEAV